MFCQAVTDDGILPYNKKDIKLHRQEDNNAELLVKKLIKNKTGDQEKFDAIFTWVTLNIKYDYNEFYSPTASIPGSIKRILKTKRTICLGYSNLMDTLCMLAGITNVTVYGYAKDDFFDVGDSLYGHNHAWNAVKLDNLWYLYDATWSIGEIDYKLTAMGKWITRWFEKHPEKLKKKKIRNRYRHKMKSICGNEYTVPIFYYKPRFFNRILRARIARLPIKTHRAFIKGINKNYYLSEPAVFGLTHISDSRTWNLGSSKTFRDLETDSAYYYLTDSVLKSQNRQGTECTECDTYIMLSKKEKLKALNETSLSFNKRNRFITSYCETALGNINLGEAYSEKDSLNRIQFIDSAKIYYTNARLDLQQCKKNISVFVMLHKKKNKRKMSLLLTENKGHTLFVSQKVKATLYHTRNFNKMLSQGEAYANNYLKKAKNISHFKINLKIDKLKPYPEKILAAIKNDLAKKETQLDSLVNNIRVKKQAYDSIMEHLSLNIWQQVKQHDSIIKPFVKGATLRRLRKDNYKKVVIDIRKNIPAFEFRYANDLNNIIYNPSEEAFVLFKNITSLIKLKTKLQRECLADNRELLKAKDLSYDALEQYRELIIKDCDYDFCWVADNYPKMATMLYGLAYLKIKQNNALLAVNIENSEERYRHYKVNDDLKTGFKHANKSIVFDLRDVKLSIKRADRYKRELTKPKKKK